MHTPATVYVYEAVPSSRVLRARARGWALTCQRTWRNVRTHVELLSWLNFQPGHSVGAHEFTRGPGHFLALLAAGVRVSPLSLLPSFSLSSSQFLFWSLLLKRIFFPSFPSSICETGTRRWFPHQVFIDTHTHVRPPNRDRKLYRVLTCFFVTTYLARRFFLRFRLCIAWHHLNTLRHAKGEIRRILAMISVIFAVSLFLLLSNWISKFISLFLLKYLMTSSRKKYAKSFHFFESKFVFLFACLFYKLRIRG